MDTGIGAPNSSASPTSGRRSTVSSPDASVSPASFAVRGAVSTGFRAPTPGQQNAFNVTTAFLSGELVNRGIVPPTSAVAVARGGRQLQPERSTHYSIGLIRQGPSMQVAIDAFRIDVSDRLALSQEVQLTPTEVDILLSEGITEARNFPVFRFFVNDFATTTQGVDLTWTWQLDRHTVGASSNFTSSRVHSLLGGVIDRRRIESIERGLPSVRWQVWARPVIGPWRFLLRYNFYGSYWDYEDANNATAWVLSASHGSIRRTPAKACWTSKRSYRCEKGPT